MYPQLGRSTLAPIRLRIVLASPKDVQEERDLVPGIVEYINSELRQLKSHLALDLSRYEVDSRPGFDAGGPQALIDRALDINESDLLVGIFWNKFGTPTPSSETGTEHEIRLACTSKTQRNKPEVVVYFRKTRGPESPEEAEQQRHVLTFKKELQTDLGVKTEDYASIDDFARKLGHHLRLFAFEKHCAQLPVIPPDLACFVSAEARTLRAGGLTELVGDIVLTCTSLDPKGLGGNYDIRVYTLPAQLTNRVALTDPTNFANLTDAVIVDHLGRTIRGVLLPHVQTGDAANTRNCLLFPSVCVSLGTYNSDLTFRATGPKTLIIRNIRVAAPEVSSTSIPSTVSCYIDVHDSFTAAAQVVANRGVLVGAVGASFDFSISGPNGETNLPLTYEVPFTPSEPPEPFSFSVCFKERFVGAFKSLPEEVEYGGGEGIGFANHGTKLRVRFRNLPVFFRIAVTETDLGACITPDGGAGAVLRSPEQRQKSREGDGLDYVELQVTAGQAIAEWECLGVRKSREPREIRPFQPSILLPPKVQSRAFVRTYRRTERYGMLPTRNTTQHRRSSQKSWSAGALRFPSGPSRRPARKRTDCLCKRTKCSRRRSTSSRTITKPCTTGVLRCAIWRCK